MWIKDVPLFIDATSINRFYDAVVRPTFREAGSREIIITEELKNELSGKAKASGTLHGPAWLSALVGAGVKVGAEGSVGKVATEAKRPC